MEEIHTALVLGSEKRRLLRGISATECGVTVDVPEGFKTDFASVPRIFWNIIPPTGDYAFAAVIHDYLYVTGDVKRKKADTIFLTLMKKAGVSFWKRRVMYRAVRLGGWIFWDKNREYEKENGKAALRREHGINWQ